MSNMRLDIKDEAIIEALKGALIFEKITPVRAKFVGEKDGEITVTTVLQDGTVETTNTARPGDVIVTNPGGEQYVMNADNFELLYEATTQPGVYDSKGKVKAIRNPTGVQIEIIAPWGKVQRGDADCFIAARYHPTNPEKLDEIYIIGESEFRTTYISEA